MTGLGANGVNAFKHMGSLERTRASDFGTRKKRRGQAAVVDHSEPWLRRGDPVPRLPKLPPLNEWPKDGPTLDDDNLEGQTLVVV